MDPLSSCGYLKASEYKVKAVSKAVICGHGIHGPLFYGIMGQEYELASAFLLYMLINKLFTFRVNVSIQFFTIFVI
ncbi:hypothetical protein SDC9_197306 [bioreactor metagenome]|uniref:Uncharacterized protein n=1 Tax=bioreactor metagenome TaxID=1076179 RepID=A0A645IMZ0_9ZZZZ